MFPWVVFCFLHFPLGTSTRPLGRVIVRLINCHKSCLVSLSSSPHKKLLNCHCRCKLFQYIRLNEDSGTFRPLHKNGPNLTYLNRRIQNKPDLTFSNHSPSPGRAPLVYKVQHRTSQPKIAVQNDLFPASFRSFNHFTEACSREV